MKGTVPDVGSKGVGLAVDPLGRHVCHRAQKSVALQISTTQRLLHRLVFFREDAVLLQHNFEQRLVGMSRSMKPILYTNVAALLALLHICLK